MKYFNNYKEFISIISSKLYISNDIYELQKECGIYEHDIIFNNKSDYIYEEYITGGMSGGSCWGTENYEIGRDEPEYNDFYRFCLLVCNTESEAIDELENIKNNFLISIDKDGSTDYYGNYTNYCYLVFDLKNYYEKRVSLKQLRKEKLDELFNT